MQVLLDNLGAALVTGGVILLLALTQSLGRSTAMSAVEFSATRVTTNAFLEVLEQDFANVCAGVPAGTECVHALVKGTEAGADTTVFEFSGVVDPVEEAPVMRLRYEARPAGTAEIAGEGGTYQRIPTFEVVRLVERGGVFEETMRTAGTVIEFDVDLLDGAGRPVGAALSNARAVDVRLAATPFTGRGDALASARFHRRFRLQHLQGA